MHQVFVCHAEEDQAEASCVCEMLEADGAARCWLANRDATATKNKAAEVLEAIRTSDLVLLVFSAAANASPGVLREMERAVAYQRPVLPVRIDEATPNASIARYLDLAAEPVAIGSRGTDAEAKAGGKATRAVRMSRRTRATILGAAVALVALGLGLGLGLAATQHQATWTELSPSGHTPPPLMGPGTYDPVTKQVIVFGTEDASGNFADTWTYDHAGGFWLDLKPPIVPPPRDIESVVFDPLTERLIMFGGWTGDLPGFAGRCLNDTWGYDPTANVWTNLSPAGEPPPERAWHAMIQVPDTGKLITFGGMTGGFDQYFAADEALNDTWAYDPSGNTWADLSPAGPAPEARYGYAMTYDPATHTVILFGGMTGAARFNDTWSYDPAANTWTELHPAGSLPSPRSAQSMVYDPTSKRLIMFGGAVSPTEMFNDTWAYDAARNRWTQLTFSGSVPSACVFVSMTRDPNTGELIVFGGAKEGGSLVDDTWALTP